MEQLGLILLAAGNSVRYQGIKLLDVIDGKKMYLHIMDKMEKLFFAKRIVVTQYDEIADMAEKRGYQVVINDHPEQGISSSLRLGLLELQKDKTVDGVLFSVCDQPYLSENTIRQIQEVCGKTEARIVCAGFGEQLGNPCAFHKDFFPELLALRGDVGGKRVIKAHMEECQVICAKTEKELIDIDVRA